MKRNFNLRPLPAYIIMSVFVALVCGSTVLMLILRRDELDEEFMWLAILPAALFLLWTVLTAMVYIRTRKRYDAVFRQILDTFPREDVEAFLEYTERLPEPEEISRWVCGKLDSYERAKFNNMVAIASTAMSRDIFWRVSEKNMRLDFGEYWENTYGEIDLGKTKDIRHILSSFTRAEFNSALKRMDEDKGSSFSIFGKMRLSSEKVISVLIQGKCIKNPATEEMVCMGTVSDIDAESRLSDRLKAENLKSRFMLDASSDAFYEVNVGENKLTSLNPKVAESIFGITDMQDFDGERRPYWELIHPDDREGFVDRFFNYDHMAIMPDQKMQYEYRIKNRDGEYIWVEHQAQVIGLEDGRVTRVIGRISDITTQKRIALKQRTNIDALTGAMLRTSVIRAYENRIYDGDRCVVLVNINGFRYINNQYGYEMGDTVLRHVVTVLWEKQQGRCVVGRLDSDTFVIAMMEVNEKHTPQKMIGKIIDSFEKPLTAEGKVVNIAVCVSCSKVFSAGSSFDEAYEQAELAMKVCKHNSKAYTNSFKEYTDGLREQAEALQTQTEGLQEQLNR